MDPASHFLSRDLRWFGKRRLWGSFFLLLLLTSVYDFDISQITVNELTSQPHCSKCCRVLRSRDTNYSGMGFVCEPKIKRNPWWIGRTLNGKQKEGANNCWATLLTTHHCPDCPYQQLSSSSFECPPGARWERVRICGIFRVEFKRRISWEVAVELLSCALLFVSAASYSSLSLSQRQTAGPRPIKNSDIEPQRTPWRKEKWCIFFLWKWLLITSPSLNTKAKQHRCKNVYGSLIICGAVSLQCQL